jgi:glycosyltransferase involved in cell wall biosynthesis
MGHEVTVATYANGKDLAGIHAVRTMPIPWRQNYEVGSSRHKILFDALLGARVLRMITMRKYDLIHAHLHEGALIGKGLGWLRGLPTIFDYQGSMTEEMIDHHFIGRESRLYKPLHLLERGINRSAPAIFVNTRNAHRQLVEKWGVRPHQLRLLPDCVNGEEFRPAEAWAAHELADLRAQLGIPPGNRVLVYLGLLAEYQGVSHLLEAFQTIVANRPNTTLLLMGFPGVDIYRGKARILGIQDSVIFTGRVAYSEAPRYLALGDAAVAPKLSLTEGAGKMLNYMAVGLPTVAFDTPVAREILGNDGLYAERGNVESLAALLELALYDEPTRRRTAKALRERALTHFDWQEAGKEIVRAYAEVTHIHVTNLESINERNQDG